MARRRVRVAIRAAREHKGVTQSDVARAMEWSLSKVIRIEKGEVNVGLSDLRQLLAYLGVTSEEEIGQLVSDARLARQERWTVDPSDREHLTPAMVELFQYEAEASVIRYFQSVVIPGILQTPGYAEAIFESYRDSMGAQTVAARVESRQRRRTEILYRASAPEYLVVLDESVLHRPIGGLAVMAHQLDELGRFIAETPLRIKILPFVAAASVLAFFSPFALHSLDGDQSVLMYREWPGQDEIVRIPAEIDSYRNVFERMWTAALPEDESSELIRARAAAMRAA